MGDLKNFKAYDLSQQFFEDKALQHSLRFSCDASSYDHIHSALSRWQENLPQWDALAKEASRPEKLPRIDKYNELGLPVEKITLALETSILRRQVVDAGIFENKSLIEKFCKIYLLAQLGESGTTCPLACTDGLIESISALGDEQLKSKYLPLLRSSEFPLAGAQFVTEQSGGSDVGAIEGTALLDDDGNYRIYAEKWYCSATDEFFLVAARPEGAPDGTAGIAIFFVPRLIELDGNKEVNSLSIKRLKNKLGTQSLPTAEIDFSGSLAFPIGNVEDGFKNLMGYVLNVSRIHNAANCLGFHRRAFVEARNYVKQRIAFGKPLIEYPLIQESLIGILAQFRAVQHLFVTSLKEINENGLFPKDKDQALWQRFLINLLKYRSALHLTDKVKESILLMGANGIIEDFSILPRLLRDSMIVETWEGPHNTLCLQILRDAQRFDFIGRLKAEINSRLEYWPEHSLNTSRELFMNAYEKIFRVWEENSSNPVWLATHARRLVDTWANLLEISSLVELGKHHQDANELLLASQLCHLNFQDHLSQFSNPLLAKLDEYGSDLIWEQRIELDL